MTHYMLNHDTGLIAYGPPHPPRKLKKLMRKIITNRPRGRREAERLRQHRDHGFTLGTF